MSFRRLHLSLFLAVAIPSDFTVAQVQNAQFNQVINLNGDMQINRLAFPDKSMIETFSQKQNQLIVNQNPNPLPASHVVGSTGQPFVQLSTTSTTISTNGATDLVGGQIELPIDPAILSQNNVSPDNTFVAKLSDDRQVWVIMEGLKSVNTTDNTVRMIKLNSIDGEYLAVGRQTTETSNVLTTFGGDQQQTVNVTGSGIQELEFVDGFRMSIMATQPMTVNTDVRNGISSSMMPDGSMMAVNNYRYLVTTSLAGVVANLNQMTAVVQLPISADRVMRMAMSMGAGPSDSIALGVAQRPVLLNPGGAVGGALAGQSPQKREPASSRKLGSAPTRAAKATGSRAGVSDPATSSDAACDGTSANASDIDTDPDTDTTATVCASSDATSAASASGDAASTSASASADSTASATGSTGASSSASTESASTATESASASTNATSAAGNNSTSSAADNASTTAASSEATQGASNTQLQGAAATQLLLAPTFTPLAGRAILDVSTGRLAVPVSQLDGEFILTMSKGGAAAAAQGARPQPQQGQPPAPQQGQPRPAGQPPAETNSSSPSPAAASQTASAAAGVPQSAAKRQTPAQPATGAGGQNTVVITMAELAELVQRQKTGGVIPVWQMMAEFKAQQAQLQGQTETPTLRVKKRSGPLRRVTWEA